MILVESGDSGESGLWAQALFAARLARAGYPAVVAAQPGSEIFAAALSDPALRLALEPHLCDPDDLAPRAVVVLAADRLDAGAMARLPLVQLPPAAPVLALGAFADRQARIATMARLGHLTGREPRLIGPEGPAARALFPAAVVPQLGRPGHAAPRPDRRARLWLLSLDKEPVSADVLRVAEILHHSAEMRVGLVLPWREHQRLTLLQRPGPELLAWGEIAPSTLARHAEIAVLLPAVQPAEMSPVPLPLAGPVVEQAATLLTDMLWLGGAVIDCSGRGLLTDSGAPVLQGPGEIAALEPYLHGTVVPNLVQIGHGVAASRWRAQADLQPVLAALAATVAPPAAQVRRRGVPAKDAAAAGIAPGDAIGGALAPAPRRAVFVPTNGSGLGHAQRCALVAGALARPVAFAAFPSCVPLLSAQGFSCMPLVQRSAQHADPRAHDLVNLRRLSAATRPGDVLVFDGSSVFDSVHRTLRDRDLRGIWLRRGLWQPGQRGKPYLQREAAFGRVIVPEEAFDELNDALTFGRHVHQVGPIVRQDRLSAAARATIRRALCARFGMAEETRIVVSMLGGGVVADRAAQILTLAGLLARRSDVLHLVVIWPGGIVPPGLSAFARNHAVHTSDAGRLAQAADFVISAAGYNSFHEVLYTGVPAIFLPQQAPVMDDQVRRARAAEGRGLADCVLAHELLMLERRLDAFLDGDRAAVLARALADCTLPAPGTADAAAVIRAEMDR